MIKRYFFPALLTLVGFSFAESNAWAQFGGGGGGGGGFSGGGGGFSGSGSSGGFRPQSGGRSLSRGSGGRGGGMMDQQFGPLRGSSGRFNADSFGGGNQFGGRGNQMNRQMGGMGNQMGNQNRNVRLSAYAFQVPQLPADPADIQPRLESILDGGTATGKSERKISLELDGNTLVMKGTVPSPRERQLAESMVRLEPGVYDVRNELQVALPK